MKTLAIYDVKQVDYHKKSGLIKYPYLNEEEQRIVPIYGNEIFQGISKTAPLATPLFAYSEVFWSYFIHQYFDKRTYIHTLAQCNDIEETYYPYGTLVRSEITRGEQWISLREYFQKYPDFHIVDKDACYFGTAYDYIGILQSDLFQNRVDLRQDLERQILLSILKRNQNFGYENIFLIEKDHQMMRLSSNVKANYSLMFLYPDQRKKNEIKKICFDRSFMIPFHKNISDSTISEWHLSFKTNLNNMIQIVKQDFEVIEEFLRQLNLFIEEIETTDIVFYKNDFFETLNSDSWKAEYARYIENNEEKALRLEQSIMPHSLDSKQFNDYLRADCLDSAKHLKFTLQVLVMLKQQDSLEEVTIENYLRIIGKEMTKEVFQNLSIDEKLSLGERQKVKYMHY